MSHPVELRLDRLATPVGNALLVVDRADRLLALDFEDYETRMRRLLRAHHGEVTLREAPAPAPLREALGRYFAGELGAVREVAWTTGGTAFQRSVWEALVRIPPGTTRSYGELARDLGVPGAARAVGWANGSNPIAIVIPCHRVIGANGRLTGYAGGVHRKQWLLRHEGVIARH